MRIAIVNDTYTEPMGYIENCLPRALADLGHEIDIVSTDLEVNYRRGNSGQSYSFGSQQQPCGVFQLGNGITLHRLPHRVLLGYPWIRFLSDALERLKPDVVQIHAVATWFAMECAATRFKHRNFLLFTGAHQTMSSFKGKVKDAPRLSSTRLASDVRRALPGRAVSKLSERCYAATTDCAQVAVQYYGVEPAKITVQPLGTDTSIFYPASSNVTGSSESRAELRASLGYTSSDIVCIYTGRFADHKDPLTLATAIDTLARRGLPYKALFLGEGSQCDRIRASQGCAVHPFVQWKELGAFYRAADIGVWPRAESLSMIDAGACGLPLVVSDRLQAVERIEGNGIQYREGNPEYLAQAILSLDAEARSTLGRHGARKMAAQFSWRSNAITRVQHYEEALERREGCRSATSTTNSFSDLEETC